MRTEAYNYQIPDFVLPAVYNADISGLDDDDCAIVEKYESRLNELKKQLGADHYTISIVDDNPYFCAFPDFTRLGCDVYDCTVTFFYIDRGAE